MTNITHLAPEIVAQILSHLDPNHEIINVDRRGYVLSNPISEISLVDPRPDLSDNLRAVGNLRRTCRKFAQYGARHMFQRLVIRFSKSEFIRLSNIARSPMLCREVRRLTYMVPRFFRDDRANIREYLELTDTMYQLPSFRQLITKASEQHEITSLGLDVAAFSEAIKAFQYLQHVQLFRVQADLDERFITHFRRNVIVGGGLVSYEWMASTLYASTTLARAMIGSGAMLRADTPLSRISCQLDPESATLLIQRSESATVLIAEHLECLSLRFELSNSPGEIEMLGVTLRDLLRVSKNMVSLHIGFPQQPVALSLHSIFQCVQLDKIRVLSLDGWRLSGQQIVAITRQYKQTLRGLRLRGVLLDVEPIEHNEEDGNGFIWRDVLVFLRNETQLQWISLRRINYAQYWDSIMAGARDVTDDGDDQSESEVEGTWDQDTTQDNADETIQEESEDDISEYEDDHSSDLNSEGGDNSIADSNLDSDHDIVPPARRARRQIGYPWDQQCSCSGDPESLHDDGEFVEKAQWKFWEKWVLGRSYCALHGQKVARP